MENPKEKEIMISGRTPAQIAERNEIRRLKYKERYENDPDFRAREIERNRKSPEEERARSRARYAKNKDKDNKRRTENARKKRETDEHYRQILADYKAAWYAANMEQHKERAKGNRRQRNPWVGITALIAACKRGECSTDELTRFIGESLIRENERTKQDKNGR